MLFFYELVDQERAKAGSTQDRKLMTDLALLGRIEVCNVQNNIIT